MAWLASVSPYGFLDAIGTVFGPFVGQAVALAWVLAYPLVIAAVAIAAGGNVGFLVPSVATQPVVSWGATGFVTLMTLCAHMGANTVARAGAIWLPDSRIF
jgi:amino acid transporter